MYYKKWTVRIERVNIITRRLPKSGMQMKEGQEHV